MTKKVIEKKKRGRKSKYENINLKQVETLGELGLTDSEISKALGISKQTLNDYKKKYPEFLDSLKKGKEISDAKVVQSLYRRAVGYSHPDVHISNYQGCITVTPIIKYYPPDPVSCFFWLTNRQPDRWKHRQKETLNDLPDIPDVDELTDTQVDDLYNKIQNRA